MNTFLSIYGKRLKFILAALFFLMVFSACKKEDDLAEDDSLNYKPADDELNVTVIDTASVFARSLRYDSIPTYNLSLSLIGSYHDPIFGRTEAKTYTQLRLPTSNVDFGNINNLEIDSVVLAMRINTVYGSPTHHRFRIREIDEPFESAEYYNYSSLQVKEGDMVEPGFGVIKPDPNTPLLVNDQVLDPQVRIRLKKEIGQRIFQASGSQNLATPSSFNEFFKGMLIETDNGNQTSGQGSLITFDLLSEQSNVTIYYRNTTNGNNLSFTFNINNDAERFTAFEHEYEGTDVYAQMSGAETGVEELFLQAGGGVQAEIEIPFVKDFVREDFLAVNKAELIFPINNDKTGIYPPINRFFIFKVEDGETTSIIDQFEGESHVNGYLDLVNSQYRINISRHLQQILYGSQENVKLLIRPGLSSVSANRTVLFGTDNEDKNKRIRLRIAFTKF